MEMGMVINVKGLCEPNSWYVLTLSEYNQTSRDVAHVLVERETRSGKYHWVECSLWGLITLMSTIIINLVHKNICRLSCEFLW